MSIATTPEAVIDLHEQGETTGKLWAGTFRCMKYMTHRQKLARDKLIRDYLGGENPQHSTEIGRAAALATLRVGLTEVPDWFKESNYGMDLADDNVLMKLYEDVESQMKAHRETQAAGIKAAKDAVKAAVSEDKQQ